jgi:hypothetical protein
VAGKKSRKHVKIYKAGNIIKLPQAPDAEQF